MLGEPFFRGAVSTRGSLLQPFPRLFQIALHAQAICVQKPEIALGSGVPLIGRHTIPAHRLDIIQSDTTAATVQENGLLITGKAQPESDPSRYLHRGIARRAFERRFQLADTIKVVGASFDNGMLHVELVREIPEAMKPRTIKISAGTQPQTIDQKPAEQKAA